VCVHAPNIFGGGSTSADVTTVSSFLPHLRALDFYQGLDSALVQGEPGRPDRADPSAWVVTLGDMNDRGFEPAITTLERGGVMTDPVNRLPLAQRYDYVFDGDSESLSALLVSPALNRLVASAIPVYINADFAGQTSDHDPLLAYINPPR